jgi:hypothetical protein
LTDEEYKTTLLNLSSNFSALLDRSNQLAERIDRALEQHNTFALDIQEVKNRLANVEKKRQISMLIPLVAASLTISLGTLALVITILFQVLQHFAQDIH